MTKKTAWSHLPNATHIDRVLASLKAHPEAWYAVSDKGWDAVSDEVWDAADAAVTASWVAVSDAGRYDAGEAAWDAARDAARYSARTASRGAIAALIAWDHSSKFLDMTSKELMMWWALSEDPACILLLPAVVAFEKIKQLEFA